MVLNQSAQRPRGWVKLAHSRLDLFGARPPPECYLISGRSRTSDKINAAKEMAGRAYTKVSLATPAKQYRRMVPGHRCQVSGDTHCQTRASGKRKRRLLRRGLGRRGHTPEPSLVSWLLTEANEMLCSGLWPLKEADLFRAVTDTVILCRIRQPEKAVHP
jgi:hypothetical protein